jgi:FAD/FMN-containing dehydrogenase
MESNDNLKGLLPFVEGELLLDDASRAIYSTGACMFKIIPLGILRPKNAVDVRAAMRFAAEKRIPVTARGAGTSRSGQELGAGLVLDFSRHMNRILEIHPEEMMAVVEPGAICGALNAELRKFGLHLPPDPSSSEYCTIGGMIANNSSGPHSLLHGSMRNCVQSLEAVQASGEAMTIRRGEAPRSARPDRAK